MGAWFFSKSVLLISLAYFSDRPHIQEYMDNANWWGKKRCTAVCEGERENSGKSLGGEGEHDQTINKYFKELIYKKERSIRKNSSHCTFTT